jgi:hypothetical protein
MKLQTQEKIILNNIPLYDSHHMVCGYAQLRDTWTFIYFLSQVSSDGRNWAPLLANCGLLLMACAQCLVTIVSGFRCYRQVCPCAGRRDRKQPSARWPLPDSPEPAGSFYSTSSKELLISNWLGQQRRHNMLLITQPPVSHMASLVRLSDQTSEGMEITRYRQPPPPSRLT